MAKINIFTDGACSGNPGVGGWGAILVHMAKDTDKELRRKELSGYEGHTTNNRMELTAVIEGLRALKEPCEVLITTDSKYVCDAFLKDWITKWQIKYWSGVKNPDLWQELLKVMKPHKVDWVWVRGHSGHIENERCDELARSAIANFKMI